MDRTDVSVVIIFIICATMFFPVIFILLKHVFSKTIASAKKDLVFLASSSQRQKKKFAEQTGFGLITGFAVSPIAIVLTDDLSSMVLGMVIAVSTGMIGLKMVIASWRER